MILFENFIIPIITSLPFPHLKPFQIKFHIFSISSPEAIKHRNSFSTFKIKQNARIIFEETRMIQVKYLHSLAEKWMELFHFSLLTLPR